MRAHINVFLACLLASCVLVSCAPLPSERIDELAPYRSAMRPQYQGQVDQIGPVPRYDIDVSVDVDRLTLAGHESVLYTNRQAQKLGELYFRLYPNLPAYDGHLVVTKVQIGDKEVGATYEAERTAMRVPLPRELAVGRTVRLDIDFSLQVKHKDDGRVLLGESQDILSLPNFYPMLAVYENGSWNLSSGPDFADAAFGEIALYRVNVNVPPDLVVVSTGSVLGTDVLPEGGRRVIRCASGPAREFGLIMSRAYEKQSLNIRGIAVNSYSLPQDAPMGYSALWRAAAALQAYSDAFGDYPYAKLDVAEAPLVKRGMEYPALIFIGSEVYRTERQRLEALVAHETAHQWWYNLVGGDPVNAPAVDEGLAEYSLFYYYQGVYGKRHAEEVVAKRWEEPFEYAKKAGLDAPVDQPTSRFMPDNYEVIIYAKSSLLYNELRRYVGNEAFDMAIRRYLRDYSYRIAPAGAFLGIVQSTTSRNLGGLLEKWKQTSKPPPKEQD